MKINNILQQVSIFLKLAAQGLVSTRSEAAHILGVSVSADEDDVKKSYRSLVRKFHTDRNKDPEA